MVYGYGGWKSNFTLAQMTDLRSKVAIVTGSNSGVGKETARQLALHGANVHLACRNPKKAEEAAKDIQSSLDSKESHSDEGDPKGGPKYSGGSVHADQAVDLSDVRAVQNYAENFKKGNDRLDILICNAAIVPPEFTKGKSPELEVAFVTSHLSHMLMIDQFLPLLQSTARKQQEETGKSDVRIVIVAADVTGYVDNRLLNPMKVSEEWLINDIAEQKETYGASAYLRTKICNVLFTRKLAQKLGDPKDNGVRVNVIHPGVISTEIFHSRSHDDKNPDSKPGLGERLVRKAFNSNLISMPPPKGAWNSLYAACAAEVQEKNYQGEYFFPWGNRRTPDICKIGKDDSVAQKLWEFSTKQLREATGNQDAVNNLDNVGAYTAQHSTQPQAATQ